MDRIGEKETQGYLIPAAASRMMALGRHYVLQYYRLCGITPLIFTGGLPGRLEHILRRGRKKYMAGLTSQPGRSAQA